MFDLVVDDMFVDGGIVVFCQDGCKFCCQVLFDGVMVLEWWGVIFDVGDNDQVVLDVWSSYVNVYGGKFVLLFGIEVVGYVKFQCFQCLVYIVGYGVKLIGIDMKWFVFEVYLVFQGGFIVGLMVCYQGIGMVFLVNYFDFCCIFGGYGIFIIYGVDWVVNSCMVSQVVSMGILFIGVNGYIIFNCNVDVCMGDGIYFCYGVVCGIIMGNNVCFIGDDGILVVSYLIWFENDWNLDYVQGGSVVFFCYDIIIVGNIVQYVGLCGMIVVGGVCINLIGNIVDMIYVVGIFILKDDVYKMYGVM